ncbi:efflux RND transporter periplasmic adaptor subunit [Odoribacter lunatus]|uniref:efflux RND transporter periplasmic adaptor subunit n=1 Tax=Odoribacter lunatus TaxID=2941335 RepID=UPI00204091CC|nr:efflux RND transporter periplasmic adaptor subunit [Odoribacter lunatus]
MKGFSYFFACLGVGLILAGVLLSCQGKTSTLEIAQLVKTTIVQTHKDDFSVTYPGVLKAASDVKLAFRVPGPIDKVWVKEGQYVKKGTLLAQLDQRDYNLQYEAAAAEYKQIKGETDRIIELYQTNSVSENDYDKAVAAQKQAWALYHARLNALEDTKLKAPFDGYIQKKYFDSYEIVNQGVPVVSMIDDNYLDVNVDIPATDYIRSADFSDYQMRVDVYPDTLLPLELVEINRNANFNQLFQVHFRLKRDKKLSLAPGMSASVTIRYKPDSGKMSVIPVSALLQEEGHTYVWLLGGKERDVVKKTLVEVCQVLKDGTAIVNAELQAGDIIVSAGVNTLKEGQQVRILPSPSVSNVGHLL